ncbi:MAG TPA: outer membrane protein assembly factor BamD [Sedimentisphaerales bacterium]|nr:outer membrane protein assembly factor BamD [Sedimentisphaerales bacterium]
MVLHRMTFTVVLAAGVVFCGFSTVCGKTWHLDKDQQWQDLSDQQGHRYISAVAEIKQLVSSGQTDAAGRAFDKLKNDFPEIAGPDLDAFIKAEMLYCQGRFSKAVVAYDKFLGEFPESTFYQAALDRQFAIATAFLAGQKKTVLRVFKIRGYAAGVHIMEKITDRAGQAPIGLKAAVAVAENYEKRKKFNHAYDKWSQISSQYGSSSEAGKQALLSMARCKHAAYRGHSYDASDLISAKSYYQSFQLRYPKDAEAIDVESIIRQINNQLSYKQFSIGRYYQETGSRLSANLYYQMVMDNWPQTEAAEMAKTAIETENMPREKEKPWKQTPVEKLVDLLL